MANVSSKNNIYMEREILFYKIIDYDTPKKLKLVSIPGIISVKLQTWEDSKKRITQY